MNVNPYLTDAQRSILERAKIGVAGLGGLGSNVLSHLVRAGVRHFVAADFDVVSESNLNRQFFFAVRTRIFSGYRPCTADSCRKQRT